MSRRDKYGSHDASDGRSTFKPSRVHNYWHVSSNHLNFGAPRMYIDHNYVGVDKGVWRASRKFYLVDGSSNGKGDLS